MRNLFLRFVINNAQIVLFFILLLGVWVVLDWKWPRSHTWNFFSTFSAMSGYSGLCLIMSSVVLGAIRYSKNRPWIKWLSRAASFALFSIAMMNVWWSHSEAATLVGHSEQYNRASLMTTATSIDFMLLAVGLFLFSFDSRRWRSAGQGLALVVILISIMALSDYIYSESLARASKSFTAMALPTAFVVLAFSLISMLHSYDVGIVELFFRNSLGGRLARRLLPLILITELAIEWFRFQYSSPPTGDGPVLGQWLAIGNPFILLIITTGTGWYLDELDKSRMKAWDELRELNQDLEIRIKERTATLQSMNVKLSAEISEKKFLEKEISEIRENIQERLGRIVHDGLSQELTGIALSLKAVEQRLTTSHSPEGIELGKAIKVLSEALVHAKNLARQIYPTELEAGGIMESLHDLVANVNQRSGDLCQFLCEEPIRLGDKELETHLFYIAQEALENAVRHSQADKVVIELSQTSAGLLLLISDNGTGIRENPNSQGIGMRILKYRAKVSRAELTIQSVKGSGTTISCLIRDRHPFSETGDAGDIHPYYLETGISFKKS